MPRCPPPHLQTFAFDPTTPGSPAVPSAPGPPTTDLPVRGQVAVLLGNIYEGGFVFVSVTHMSCIAFPSLQISHLCAFCDILWGPFLQRRCTGCWVAFADPRCFLSVTASGTTHAHMCWPLLWGLHQMGHSFATFGAYAPVGSVKWIMRALNSQGLRLWWLHHSCCMNHIGRASMQKSHQCKRRFTCVLFACIGGGYHILP